MYQGRNVPLNLIERFIEVYMYILLLLISIQLATSCGVEFELQCLLVECQYISFVFCDVFTSFGLRLTNYDLQTQCD